MYTLLAVAGVGEATEEDILYLEDPEAPLEYSNAGLL
jgi:hypothetical protein